MTYEAKSNSPLILKQKPHMVVCLVKSYEKNDTFAEKVGQLKIHTRVGQTCSMYEPHIVKPKLQRAAT